MSKRTYFLLLFLACTLLGIFYFSDKKLSHKKSDVVAAHNRAFSDFRNGDIIFQTSTSAQSRAIQLATNSIYSHVGILYEKNNAFYVLEAVQPVKLTPLKEWVKRGEKEHYVVKRLKNSDSLFTTERLLNIKKEAKKYLGKDYDLYFEWSDDRMYCSELVWKIYSDLLGVKLSEPEKLSDFDLSHELVQAKLKERYGNEVPLGELVVSPASIFNSDILETIEEGEK